MNEQRKFNQGGGLFARAKGRLAVFDDKRMERRILRCSCAAHDKPFDGVFIRRKGEDKFTFKEALLPKPGEKSAPPASPEKISFDADEFELDSMHCPHCKASHWIHCGKCKLFVCDARSEDRSGHLFFRCAHSCGNDGLTSTLTRVEAYKPAGPLALPNHSSLLRIRDMR